MVISLFTNVLFTIITMWFWYLQPNSHLGLFQMTSWWFVMNLDGWNRFTCICTIISIHNLFTHHSRSTLINTSRWFAIFKPHWWNKYSHKKIFKLFKNQLRIIYSLLLYFSWHFIIVIYDIYNLSYFHKDKSG